MVQVFIPPPLRTLTDGRAVVSVQGRTVRDVVAALDAQFPGIAERICDGEDLKPGLAVAVDNRLCTEGLLATVDDAREVHFLPAIGGG